MWLWRAALRPCSMKNPALPEAGQGGCLDDAPGGCGAAPAGGAADGAAAGWGLWFFAPSAAALCPVGGQPFCAMRPMGMDLAQLRCVPGGYPHGGHGCHACGHCGMGNDPWTIAAGDVFRSLAVDFSDFGISFQDFCKNFCENTKIFQKCICICEKMEYNKV